MGHSLLTPFCGYNLRLRSKKGQGCTLSHGAGFAFNVARLTKHYVTVVAVSILLNERGALSPLSSNPVSENLCPTLWLCGEAQRAARLAFVIP